MKKSRQELLNQASESYKNLQFRDDFLFCKILGNNPEITRELKKSYVIFICMTDPFTEGRHIYTFENACHESPGLKMGDDAIKVFLNASGNLDDVSENLMEFFNLINTGRGSTDLCNKIEKEVLKASKHNEWRSEYMTLYMRDQENIEKGIEKGRENQLKDSISRMIMTKRFSNAEIADLLGTSLETVTSVEKELLIAEG